MNAKFLVCVAAQGAQEMMRRAMHETLRVGRNRDGNDVSLPGDVTLSGHHCEFFHRDNAWHVRDLETETGTFVNDERITEQVLMGGARVRVGIAEIVYTPEVEVSLVPDALEPAAPVLRPPGDLLGASSNGSLRIRPQEDNSPPEEYQIRQAGSGRRAKVREIE